MSLLGKRILIRDETNKTVVEYKNAKMKMMSIKNNYVVNK